MTIQRRPVTRFIPPAPVKPTLFLDIETLPTADLDVIQMLADKIKPPANYSKAETIANWERSEKPQLVADAVHKTGFDGTYGRVCCIGWAYNDKPVQSLIGEEHAILHAFFQAVEKMTGVWKQGDNASLGLTVVGHNIKAFDIRFIWQRAVINKLIRPRAIPWQATYWDDRIQDTMLIWNPDTQKRISLDRLCKALGVRTPKGDFDGSMVATAWENEEFKKISTYCEADVEATRECWWRMQDGGFKVL